MEFTRGQKALGEVKAALPKAKISGGKKYKNYVYETDLVFLKKTDLDEANKIFIRKEIPELSYFLTVTEKITGLTRFAYVLSKDAHVVTPIVVKLAKEMAKSLKSPLSRAELAADKGGEFSMKELSKHFKKAYNVSSGVSVENKNSQFQKCFFQILRQRKATSIADAMKQSEKLLNNTFNKIHKKTSNELVERGDEEENIKEYNSKRKSFIAGDKRLPFEVGQHVRILIKDKKAGIAYKRYKNETYSQAVYLVTKVTKKSKPRKYRVNGKWWLQSHLLKSAPRDEESNKLVEDRDEEYKGKELKERHEHVEERLEQIAKEEQMKKRPKRRAGEAAKFSMVHQKQWLDIADDRLDAAEDEDEKLQIVEDKKQLAESKKKLEKKLEKKPVEKKKVEKKPVEKKKVEKKKVEKKKEPEKTKMHKTLIRWAEKHGVPSGGTHEVLFQRLKKYKKQMKLKRKIKKLKAMKV